DRGRAFIARPSQDPRNARQIFANARQGAKRCSALRRAHRRHPERVRFSRRRNCRASEGGGDSRRKRSAGKNRLRQDRKSKTNNKLTGRNTMLVTPKLAAIGLGLASCLPGAANAAWQ